MASSSSNRSAKKRLFEGDSNTGKAYKFHVLLSNGTTVLLTIRDPKRPMLFEEFIDAVKVEYSRARTQFEWMKSKRRINFYGGNIHLEDANKNVITKTINFEMFKPNKCHILKLYDGSGDFADTFENMWDLTPDTDLLMNLPEEYTFETALADLIDNSLQAVWSNGENERRLISVDIARDRISIFDTGPGMDGTDENSIVKWGKMGASLHRASKGKAIGGKPPYLTPYFGMFGYGGPIASMHLGRHVLVSSKTKVSKEVYTLHLEKEALLKCSDAELTWRTRGGIRVPSKEESAASPHGSFMKVEILEPKLKNLDIFQLQCKLKDIYFPYIQCDEVSRTGKTTRPIEFQVDGVDLAEVEGGEIAVTNLHSCNGDDFVLQLHFSLGQGSSMTKSPGGSWLSQAANARLKFVYFPVKEGRESIEIIIDKLKSDGCGATENFETFSRVSVRRLGRLLPDARWAWLPFMDLRQRKGEKAHLLKKFCMRVKCFIDTDAGFNPTPSKTDLAHQNPFTIALKNFSVRTLKEEKDINVEVRRHGKLLSPLQLEKEYQDWLMKMHEHDEGINCGVDQPTLILSPKNNKSLGISSDVARVHRILKRKGAMWKSGQKVKLLKGAYAGIHNKDVYATLEYFIIEGFQGDPGGEARMICRPLGVPDDEGCNLVEKDGITILDVCSSLSLPLSVIDSEKCVHVDAILWHRQVEKQRQKSPSMIELLNETQCQELEVFGALPTSAKAGVVPPKEIVAVVRPGIFISSSASTNLDQKDIVKNGSEMLMEIKFIPEAENLKNFTMYLARIASTSRKGFQGLYVFDLEGKVPNLFQRAGVYIFSFSLNESTCKSCEKKVLIKGSSKVGKWKLSSKQNPELTVRVGSVLPQLSVVCYDIYDNRIPFKSIPYVLVKLFTSKSEPVHVDKFKLELSTDKLTLRIKDILIECSELDKIRPLYKAVLVISAQHEVVSVSVPCKVTPGFIKNVAVQPPTWENILLPGSVVEFFKFEMFDVYGNHVKQGLEVELTLDGFCFEDQLGSRRKVDDCGCIDLSGLLKVTAGYGNNVSLSVLSDDEVLFKQEFQTEKRELRVVSEVTECCTAGSQLEDIIFEVVDSNGDVDITIHNDDRIGQSHTLAIKSELVGTEDSIRYAFRQGRCTVPAISLPQNEGCFCIEATHARYTELHLSIKVNVIRAPIGELDEGQTPCSDGKVLVLGGSSPDPHMGNQMLSIMTNIEELEEKISKYGLRVGSHEESLKSLEDQKAKCEQVLSRLQASIEPRILDDIYPFLTKEEMIKRIESRDQSAAALVCDFAKKLHCHQSQTNFMKDIVGLVALTGTVRTNRLSRILAEYLGEDQMLALVCRSLESACVLEKYGEDGRLDFTLGLRAAAAALGKSIVGRFLVICLEDIRPYSGKFNNNDPQRRLALPHPKLPRGFIPPGFEGYAVNMVDLDDHQIHTRTVAGHGLRETLLYQLFGTLQVYKTREDMINACPCIQQGAVSLDGGILRGNGIISLGYGNPTICFPVVPHIETSISPEIMESLKDIDELKSVLHKIMLLMEKHSKARDKALKKLRKIEDEWNMIMDGIEPKLERQDECNMIGDNIKPKLADNSHSEKFKK